MIQEVVIAMEVERAVVNGGYSESKKDFMELYKMLN